VIRLRSFMEILVRSSGGIQNIGDDELNATFIILLFLAVNAQKEIDTSDEMYTVLITSMQERLKHAEGWRNISSSHFIMHGGKMEKTETDTLTDEIIKKFCLGYTPRDLNNIYTSLYFNDPAISGYEYLFDFIPISVVSLVESTKFDSDIIRKLAKAFVCKKNRKVEGVTQDEVHTFLLIGALVYKLAQAYDETKQHYFKNNRETMFIEVEEADKNRQRVQAENSELLLRLDAQNKEIKLQQRENRRLKAEIESLLREQADLPALRELAFSLEMDEEPEAISIDFDIIKSVEFVIAGGSDAWQTRMKEYLPNSIFIPVSADKFDIRLLRDRIVFVNTRHISHSQYYRIIENMSDRKLHFFRRSNVRHCLMDIAKIL